MSIASGMSQIDDAISHAKFKMIVISVCLDSKIINDPQAYRELCLELKAMQDRYFNRGNEFVFFNIGSSITSKVLQSDNQRNVGDFDKLFQEYIEVFQLANMRSSLNRLS